MILSWRPKFTVLHTRTFCRTKYLLAECEKWLWYEHKVTLHSFEMDRFCVNVFFLVTALELFVSKFSVSETVYHSVLSGSSLSIGGCRDSAKETQYILQWKFEDKILFYDNFMLYDKFIESASLIGNNSLVLNPVSLIHTGTYRCLVNFVTIQTHVLRVKGMYNSYLCLFLTSSKLYKDYKNFKGKHCCIFQLYGI